MLPEVCVTLHGVLVLVHVASGVLKGGGTCKKLNLNFASKCNLQVV